MRRAIGILLLLAAVAGCSSPDSSEPPAGANHATDRIPKDYEPTREEARAIELRDRLTAAGYPCRAKPKVVNRYKDNLFGNVLSLTCSVDDQVAVIAVFRTATRAEAGVAKLGRLQCVFNDEATFYVADDDWVVITTQGEDGPSTREGTTPVADALGRPVEGIDCP